MIDLGFVLIMIISGMIGSAKGIGNTIIRLLGLAAGIYLGVVCNDTGVELLRKTPLDELIRSKLDPVESSGTGGSGLFGTIGGILEGAKDAFADKVTDLIMMMMGFLAIVLAVWFVTAIIRLLFRKKRKEAEAVGCVDSFFGLLIGLVVGALAVIVATAAIIPVTALVAPLKVPEMISAMHGSLIIGVLESIKPIRTLLKFLVF
jgi:uncharacterized membrane protein required for colicin V production